MGGLHTPSVPFCSATKRISKKLALHLSLFSHVRLNEKYVDSFIQLDFVVKQVNCGFNCRFTPDVSKETLTFNFLTIHLVAPSNFNYNYT